MTKPHRLLAGMLVFLISSCQQRTLCKIKTAGGGTAFNRVYANTYDTPDEYNAAIAALKAEGYTCDDSDVLSNQVL
jgi:hypothetical protein